MADLEQEARAEAEAFYGKPVKLWQMLIWPSAKVAFAAGYIMAASRPTSPATREAVVDAMIASDALSADVRAQAMIPGSTQREPFLMFADALLAAFTITEKGAES